MVYVCVCVRECIHRHVNIPCSSSILDLSFFIQVPLFLCIDHWRRLYYLFLLFFGTLHSEVYIFPFLLCFLLPFFSQLFVRPPQTAFFFFFFPVIKNKERLLLQKETACLDPDADAWSWSEGKPTLLLPYTPASWWVPCNQEESYVGRNCGQIPAAAPTHSLEPAELS